MITSVREFVGYFRGIRKRTWSAVDCVTAELLDWAPRPGEFSCGEIIRHIAGAERFFVAKVVDDRWTDDLDPGPKLDYAATRARLKATHREEMARLYGYRMEDVVSRARVDQFALRRCPGKRSRAPGLRPVFKCELKIGNRDENR